MWLRRQRKEITRGGLSLARVIGEPVAVLARLYGMLTLVASPLLVMVKTPVVVEA
jgi:hypothetical protein